VYPLANLSPSPVHPQGSFPVPFLPLRCLLTLQVLNPLVLFHNHTFPIPKPYLLLAFLSSRIVSPFSFPLLFVFFVSHDPGCPVFPLNLHFPSPGVGLTRRSSSDGFFLFFSPLLHHAFSLSLVFYFPPFPDSFCFPPLFALFLIFKCFVHKLPRAVPPFFSYWLFLTILFPFFLLFVLFSFVPFRPPHPSPLLVFFFSLLFLLVSQDIFPSFLPFHASFCPVLFFFLTFLLILSPTKISSLLSPAKPVLPLGA